MSDINLKEIDRYDYYLAILELLDDNGEVNGMSDSLIISSIEDIVQNTLTEFKYHYKYRYIMETSCDIKPVIQLEKNRMMISNRCGKDNDDNIVIFMAFLKIIAEIQVKLIIDYNLFYRGEIFKENTILNDSDRNKAFIGNYKFKSELSYPSVVIQEIEVNNILRKINLNIKNTEDTIDGPALKIIVESLICKDINKKYFINYLESDQWYPKSEEDFELQMFFEKEHKAPLYRNISILPDEREIQREKEKFEKHRNRLKEKMVKYGSFSDLIKDGNCDQELLEQRLKHQRKYIWLMEYHNKSAELSIGGIHNIEYKSAINNFTHLPEFEIIENIELPRKSQAEHYVAFVDVLGYKSYFESDNEATEKFLDTIKEAIEYCKNEVDRIHVALGWEIPCKPNIKIFSDNILIFIECEPYGILAFSHLTSIISRIQYSCIKDYGLFLRGGFTKGMFYSDENIVFGKALIDAYELESKKAYYPRIIVDTRVVEETISYLLEIDNQVKESMGTKKFLERSMINIAKDTDGEYFINYLKEYQFFKEIDGAYCHLSLFELLFEEKYYGENGNNYFQESIQERLVDHKKELVKKLGVYGKYFDIRSKKNYPKADIIARKKVQEKYLWSVEYHNKTCEVAGMWEHKVNYSIIMDNVVHLPIVKLHSDN